MHLTKRRVVIALGGFLLVSAAVLTALAVGFGRRNQQHTATTFAMDTVVQQDVWGPNAIEAMRAVNAALAAHEQRLSLFGQGDIARINAAAGAGGAEVAPETAALLRQALALGGQSDGAFAITIAPLTLAWGITGDAPRVVPAGELRALLPLVNDTAVAVEGNRVALPVAGMGIDLGGIAKGAACAVADAIYDDYGIETALLYLGGNIYARGVKPDGTLFRVGFENPEPGGEAYLCSFTLRDSTVAVSGGKHRYFEVNGRRYIHILDPETGAPAESDIAAVGVVDPDGAAADFWSTTLYVWGRDKTLAHMRAGGTAIMLDTDGKLWVSESLREGFRPNENAGVAEVEFVPGG